MMRRPQNLKKSHLFWQNSCLYSVASKPVGDFFKFLWTFQKSWALPHTYLVLSTYFANDHPSQDLSLKKTNNESLEFRRTIKCWYAIRTFLSRGATLYIVFQMLWNFRFIVGIDGFEIFHVFFNDFMLSRLFMYVLEGDAQNLPLG